LAPLGEVVALGPEDCDFVRPRDIRDAVRSARPDVIVNSVAFTAVDKAETAADLARVVNADAPGLLGEEAKALGALVVHYSTDYVFDGCLEGVYDETSLPNPLNVYGRTKLAGDMALQQSGAPHFIFRTSWVVGAHGANFAKTILRLAAERDTLNVVADQRGAPTSAALIANVTADVLHCYLPDRQPERMGLYNLVAAGETTWHEYAQYVVAYALSKGLAIKLRPAAIRAITTREYPSPAPRPLNSCLNTHKLRSSFGIDLPHWKTALEPVLAKVIAAS
jgi:dTDP-4-dehydrorhamnose reductase